MIAALKVDLHRHLEGSHSAAALAAAAERFGITHEVFFDHGARRFRDAVAIAARTSVTEASDDPRGFYGCIVAARAAYVSLDAIAFLAERAFLEAAPDCDGLELRVSVFSMTRTLVEHERGNWRDLSPAAFCERAREVLVRVLRARDAAVRATGKAMLVRVGLSRTFESAPHYRALVPLLAEHRTEICGLDVLGIVTGPDTEPLPDELRAVLDGMRAHVGDLSIHAGEFADHRSVLRSLALEPAAIGHGIRSLDDEATIRALVDRGVVLELCPTSNRLLVPSTVAALVERHGHAPWAALQRAGVRCVLGSDDPEVLATSHARERDLAAAVGMDLAAVDRQAAVRFAALQG
jgi:hypothetical protein